MASISRTGGIVGSPQLGASPVPPERARVVPLGAAPATAVLRRILASHPHVVALRGGWRAGRTVIALRPVRWAPAGADPFRLLREVPATDPRDGVCGGWFGTLRYDLGERRYRGPIGCAAGDLAYFDRVLRQRVDGVWELAGLDPLTAPEVDRYRRLVVSARRSAGPQGGYTVGATAFRSRSDHLTAVRTCQEQIAAGEIFQANICLRITGGFRGDAGAAFAWMSERLRPVRGAFVRLGGATVLSMSPELYLDRNGTEVTSAPIKGTTARYGTARAARQALRESMKDRSENVMIVDLVRNDLGRLAVPGSVRVPGLLEIEPHPGVWHLVSRVTATVPSSVDTAGLLRATFPPGSVTGCPKLAALDTIDRLEAGSRGMYTGAVGYISGAEQAEWNVAIRTLEIGTDRFELGVGGGITADSDPAAEWAECWMKAAPLLRVLRAGSSPSPPL